MNVWDQSAIRAAGAAELEVVHDQRGLRRAVHEEARLGSLDFELEVDPHARFHVGVGLVDSRCLLPQSLPREPRARRVLDGVIAPQLIVHARVGGADVEALERIGSSLYVEGQADETARIGHLRDRRSRDVELDGAILEFAVRHDGEHRVVVGFVSDARLQVERSSTSIGHGLGARPDEGEVVERERSFLGNGVSWRQSRGQRGGQEDCSHVSEHGPRLAPVNSHRDQRSRGHVGRGASGPERAI